MNRAPLRRLVVLSWLLAGGAAASGVASSNAPPAANGADGGTFDAGGDTAAPSGNDAAPIDARSPSDGGVDADADTSEGDAGIDGDVDADADASEDAATDGSIDGATMDAGVDAADAAPALDDAGCPIPSGVTVSLADAGIPSSGLVLWLRSDIGVDTIDADGDGGVVCRWEDVSGNAQSFTPASATPPTRVLNALGSAPAVSFNGSGQNLSRAGVLGIGATSARTVAVYSQTADTTHRWEAFFQGVDGSPGTYFGLDANTYQTAGSLEGAYVTDNSFDSDLATTTNARTHILSISSFVPGTGLPGALTYAVDGTTRTLTSRSGGGTVEDFSGANFTSVGYGAAGFTSGMIGEVIVYDRELTAPERTTIEQHFAARF